MKKRVNKIVWMVMLIAALTQTYTTLSSANTSIRWSEVKSGTYDSLLDNVLMSKNELSEGGLILSTLQHTPKKSEADIVINKYGDLGANQIYKMNEQLDSATDTDNLGSNSSTTVTIKENDVYLITLHDGTYAKLRIDRFTSVKVVFSYVLQKTAPEQIQPAKIEIMLQLENKAALVNGKAQSMEVAPTLMNETTMVPLRFIAEALGATVSWNAEESKITINMDKDTAQLWVGKVQSKVNGQPRDMIVPATIVSGNTLVPVRFVSENLNQDVAYNPDSQTITIKNKEADSDAAGKATTVGSIT